MFGFGISKKERKEVKKATKKFSSQFSKPVRSGGRYAMFGGEKPKPVVEKKKKIAPRKIIVVVRSEAKNTNSRYGSGSMS